MMVSICCLAYNHEKYLRKALESFVMQQTDFDYEVIVHDDASTDGTIRIIQEYAQKYPDIIKPIFQKENQHSKGIKISATFVYPAAQGKFIALCEGDDYWTDPLKLQKQVDYMQAHPDCRLCFTNGRYIRHGQLAERVIPYVKRSLKVYRSGDADYDMGQMALLDHVPTASLLFYREDICNYPPMPGNVYTGDTFIRLYLTSLGYAHCIDEDTCVYRLNVPGSLTDQWGRDDQKMMRFMLSSNNMSDVLNALTQFKYDTQLTEVKVERESVYYALAGPKRVAWQKKYRKLYWEKGISEYIHYFLRVWFPKMRRVWRKFKLICTDKKRGENP